MSKKYTYLLGRNMEKIEALSCSCWNICIYFVYYYILVLKPAAAGIIFLGVSLK